MLHNAYMHGDAALESVHSVNVHCTGMTVHHHCIRYCELLASHLFMLECFICVYIPRTHLPAAPALLSLRATAQGFETLVRQKLSGSKTHRPVVRQWTRLWYKQRKWDPIIFSERCLGTRDHDRLCRNDMRDGLRLYRRCPRGGPSQRSKVYRYHGVLSDRVRWLSE